MTTNGRIRSKRIKRYNSLLNRFKHITVEQMTYVAFGCYILATLLNYTVIPKIFQPIDLFLKLLKYSCCIVFLYKSCINLKRDKKVSLSIVIFIILTALSFIFSQNRNLFLFFCTLVGLRKMNISKLIKIAYYVSIMIFLSTISLSLLGAIPNWTFPRGDITRNSLGFIFATDCIGIYLSIILMYFYLKRSNARIFEIILLEILNIFLYKATDGRLSFILITILLAMLMISKLPQLTCVNTKKKYVATIKRICRQLRYKVSQRHFIQKTIKIVCYILPTILFVAYNSLTIACMNNPNDMKSIDRILSSRLKYTAQAYKEYHVPLFGKNIKWQGWGGYGYVDEIDVENFEYNFVDSSYARLIFDFGVIYTLAVLIAYTYSLIYYLKKKDYWALIVIVFILIWSFIEPYMISVTRNPLVLLLIPILELGPNLYFKKQKILKHKPHTPPIQHSINDKS